MGMGMVQVITQLNIPQAVITTANLLMAPA
jgi:hypothetical protein